ncbi:MAG: hypothetical protein KGJ09_00905 [Candidatus Omnitrophica bacterium]|nr:hypothetical protein [Candidatus Omnitrophota bacterium]MDE2008620.1 hypothetical protein [Candidatus Omnitrophota bacterium]MDE2214086.1 hypothetical protein [Candidatus Omnitrophota bacterium]MDE2230936.1 hypothetical protein [Candidatus Omnitrophota bacterium]
MKTLRYVSLSLAGWYLFLITLHYFNRRPLWNDEYCIFLNIKNYSTVDLFSKPLLDLQAFPRFYLWMIQRFSGYFHFQLWALRFLPFACMVTAFGVWLGIASREFKDRAALGLYILCWPASVMLVYYASELKQYSMDVLAAALCLWCLYRGLSRWWYVLPFLCFVSYPSVFWIPLFLWNLWLCGKRTGQWRPLVLYTCVAVSALLVFYCFDVSVTRNNLSVYWHDYFISFDSPRAFFGSLGKNLNNLISRWFAERPHWMRGPSRLFMGMGLVYMLAAFWGRFKKDGFEFKSVVPAAFAVFWLHLIFGAIHKYPFVCPRTSLFFCPVLLMLAVMAIERLKGFNKRLGAVLQAAFVVFLAITSIGIARILCTGTLGFDSVLWQ